MASDIVVTGGAGFIGSNLICALLKHKPASKILIIDNLSSGSLSNIPKNKRVSLAKLDIKSKNLKGKLRGATSVFHFAADPSVEKSIDAKPGFESNVIGTFNLLEACRKNDIKQFIFASTSTVYGEAEKIPTPETCPVSPISNYGASKLACEAYVSSFANSYGIKSTILRYANIYGPPSTHGVMFDFHRKLKKNPNRLEILGDGKQRKSYLYISDCISATLIAVQKQKSICDAFNIGSEKAETVAAIANFVGKSMSLSPKFSYAGGARGWKGDVRAMLLNISKIRKLGFKPKVSLEAGIQKYISSL